MSDHAALAWDINVWNEDVTHSGQNKLSHMEIEVLAKFLTRLGYAKPKAEEDDLSLGDLRKLAAKAKKTLFEFLEEPRATTRQSTDR